MDALEPPRLYQFPSCQLGEFDLRRNMTIPYRSIDRSNRIDRSILKEMPACHPLKEKKHETKASQTKTKTPNPAQSKVKQSKSQLRGIRIQPKPNPTIFQTPFRIPQKAKAKPRPIPILANRTMPMLNAKKGLIKRSRVK
jgi:hypothetical protein